MKKQLVAAALAGALIAYASMGVAQAFNLGSVLGGVAKVGGVTVLVDKYGSSINDFLNRLLKQNNLGTTYATKVVPIVSIGNGAYIGAAQVMGPRSEVDRVKAVAQLEAKFNNVARVKGLVPVDNINPTGAARIQGVGVSATIDLRI